MQTPFMLCSYCEPVFLYPTYAEKGWINSEAKTLELSFAIAVYSVLGGKLL